MLIARDVQGEQQDIFLEIGTSYKIFIYDREHRTQKDLQQGCINKKKLAATPKF